MGRYNLFNTVKSIKSTIDSTVAAKDKVVAHVKEHKEAYIAGAASSATTAALMLPLITKGQIVNTKASVKGIVNIGNTAINVTNTVQMPKNMPIMVRCKETGEIYRSVNRAANCLGMSRKQVVDGIGSGTFEWIDYMKHTA